MPNSITAGRGAGASLRSGRDKNAAARLHGVDVFRTLAIFAVVCIHAGPFMKDGAVPASLVDPGLIVNQLSRFAVPYFFVISGYFWGCKIRRGADVAGISTAAARRIGRVFLFWCVVYLMPINLAALYRHGLAGPFEASYRNLHALLSSYGAGILLVGTKDHLWFLPALICIVLISAFFLKRGWRVALAVLAVSLFLFGLLAKAYVDTPVGIDIRFNTRNGPFFGLVLFVSGYALSKFRPQARWFGIGGMILLLGYAIQFCELYLLQNRFGTTPLQDYVAGTYLTGIGAALIALSNVPVLHIPLLSRLGRYVIGIYTVQYVFVDMLKPLHGISPVWDVVEVLLIFALSTLAVLALAENRFTARFVT